MEKMTQKLKQLDEQYTEMFGGSYLYDFANDGKEEDLQIKEMQECIKQGKECGELFPTPKGRHY